MSDRLSQKCEELGIDEDAFDSTRAMLRKAQEAAAEASAAVETDLANMAGVVDEAGIKELRQAAEVLLIDGIVKALIEE